MEGRRQCNGSSLAKLRLIVLVDVTVPKRILLQEYLFDELDESCFIILLWHSEALYRLDRHNHGPSQSGTPKEERYRGKARG